MGLKKRIHVNKHVIKSNVKHGEDEPTITVKTYKSNDYGKKVEILDKSGEVIATLKQEMDKPLSCGARVYIETNAKVRIGNKIIN